MSMSKERKFTKHNVAQLLLNQYNFRKDTNKIYETINAINNFYIDAIEVDPDLYEDNEGILGVIFDYLDEVEKNQIQYFGLLTFFFYAAYILTLEEIPVIQVTNGKPKKATEKEVDKFTTLFIKKYKEISTQYCEKNNIQLNEVIEKETSVYLESTRVSIFYNDLGRVVHNFLFMYQLNSIKQMLQIQEDLIQLINDAIFIDVTMMESMSNKLDKMHQKLKESIQKAKNEW